MLVASAFVDLFVGLAAGTALLAACRGGDRPLRRAGFATGLSWAPSQAACSWTAPAGPIVLLLVDLALTLTAAALAWKSPRLWPAFAAAGLAVATAAHLIVLIAPPPSLAAHALLTQACRLGVSLILVGAAVRYVKSK